MRENTKPLTASRNALLDFWKFVFSVVVVLYHTYQLRMEGEFELFPKGYLAVEFFFVCSGIFMAASAEKNSNHTEMGLGKDTFSFLKKKIKGLMPNFYVAWALTFLVRHIDATLGECVRHLAANIWELTGITYSGLYHYPINAPVWYISAMLLAMLVLYPLMRKYKDTFFYIIAPLIFIFMMGISWQKYHSLGWASRWTGLMMYGTYRAFMEIAFGCVLYKAALFLKKVQFTSFARIMLALAEILGYAVSVVYMFYNKNSRYDYCVLVILACSITITYANVGILSGINKIKGIFGSLKWLGEYSYSLFLGHWMWAKKLTYFFPSLSYREKILYYLVLSFLSGLVIMYISKGLGLFWKAYGDKLKRLVIEEGE